MPILQLAGFDEVDDPFGDAVFIGGTFGRDYATDLISFKQLYCEIIFHGNFLFRLQNYYKFFDMCK